MELVQDLPDLASHSKAGPNSINGHSRPNHDVRRKRFSITELFTEASQVVPPQNREGDQIFEMMMLDGTWMHRRLVWTPTDIYISREGEDYVIDSIPLIQVEDAVASEYVRAAAPV
eukprot:CAMPEP_0172181478 /NCGR_PEP_ID=MMETSP1050-20130122/17841_1 /TAXON_ID=233186 /ORGANISM="Cryptomonas curvata, Strain CCAP979/52" /LENGTH=115 /DNA_ID=CAMNT_0012854767 /DNA_START=144 /DNA_END=488 /DNA_ORIENTATION=+